MKVWKTIPRDPGLAAGIAEALNLPLILAEILVAEGHSEPAEIKRFLNPRLGDLSDPFLLPDMRPAVSRLLAAIQNRESIVVHGDYDTDGIVSAALLTQVLRRLGAWRVTPCLPNRLSEGYGLSGAAIRLCHKQDHPGLLVTVDCGSSDEAGVRLARQLGMDVLITDHHACATRLKEACAVVNPHLGARQELQTLAGVGVVFKVCHALVKFARECGWAPAHDLDLREYLDLVAVGTIADIVPLLGENRIMVKYGLSRLNSHMALCWRALAEVGGMRKPIDAQQVAFGFAPRLNAAGRLGDAHRALELILTTDPERARAIALELDGANRARQKIESKILAEASREVQAGFDAAADFGLVLGQRGWHSGVIGIVAARLVALYQRPVAVIAFDEDGNGRGSCRSIDGCHIVDALAHCADFLVEFGGHAMAAGFEIRQTQLAAFRQAFNRRMAQELSGRDLTPVQDIHSWVSLESLNMDLFAALEALRPFGRANPQPVLALRGARIEGAPRRIGEKHLRLTLCAGRSRIEAIAFGMADRALPPELLDVAFLLQKNCFAGRTTLELNVRDVRAAAPQESAA